MLFNKKGDLAISTNAIVILIIAVIMLGLIITFVTQGFGAVSDKFFGEIEQMPNPPPASGSRPITTSEVTIGHPGEPIGLKIAVFNTNDQRLDATPEIVCDNDVLDTDTIQVNDRPIEPRESAVFVYVQEVDTGAAPGKHLCEITVDGLTDISADIIIEVRD